MTQDPTRPPGSLPEPATVVRDPVGESLRGAHAHLARRRGRVLAYPTDVATFTALPEHPEPADWADLRALVGAGGTADLFSHPAVPPEGWTEVFRLEGRQLVLGNEAAARLRAGPHAETLTGTPTVALGEADATEVGALAALTRPGPFRSRTHELGGFRGIRREGALVAMAGHRLRPPGWCEVSAVCVAPQARGRGYAAAVVEAVAHDILLRGERPFLHVAAANERALRLYLWLGFEVAGAVTFRGFRTPDLLESVLADADAAATGT